MNKHILPFAVALAISATLGVSLRAHAAPAESADQAKPLGVGAVVPDAVVKTAAGKEIALKQAISGKPTVLIFYRGGWCPFCTRHLGALAKSQADLTGLGYQILAISADAPEDLPATSEKHKLGYTLLSDADMKASDAFGLAFYLDEATTKRYEGRFKLSGKHAGRYWLPVPAVYLVGKDGRIAFVHTDPDYRQRLPIEDLLKTARAESGKAAAK
jgi:peroxiredoxin